MPLRTAMTFRFTLQQREESARLDTYAHLTCGRDEWRNPRLIWRICVSLPYYPIDEKDFLKDVCWDDLYSDGGMGRQWTKSAIVGVRDAEAREA